MAKRVVGLSKQISTRGVSGKRLTSFFGNIYIPAFNIDSRDKYVYNCLRTSLVCILTEDGQRIDNVLIPKNLKNYIEFPKDSSELGSLVFLVNRPKHNIPVITAILDKDDEISSMNEGLFDLTKQTKDGFVQISGDANSGNILIKSYSKKSDGGNLNITVNNSSKKGVINLSTDDIINLNSRNKIGINSSNEVNLEIYDLLVDTKKSILTYKRGEGLNILDEFENQIKTDSKGNVFVKGKKVVIGSGTYSLKDLLNDIIKELSNSTVTTSLGIQPLLNKVQIINLQNKVSDILDKF